MPGMSGSLAPVAVASSGIELPVPEADGAARTGTLEVAWFMFAGEGGFAGDIPSIPAEVRGQPGILTNLWLAIGDLGTDEGIVEDDTLIRIYIDDEDTPAIECPINTFFCYAYEGGVFNTERVGRTYRGNYGAGDFFTAAYRSLWMPFNAYLRVEVVNRSTEEGRIYIMADYQILVAPYAGEQARFHLANVFDPAHVALTECTIVDAQGIGPGQLESITIGVRGPSNVDWQEGNIRVFVDGETRPRWHSSGGEDAFNGGFYTVPVGGFPGGRCGDNVGNSTTYYRFFTRNPIRFKTGIKVMWNVGQRGQASLAGTVGVNASVGYWTQDHGAISYDAIGATEIDDAFAYADGALPAPWTVNGVGSTIAVAANSAVMTDAAATDRFAIRPVVAADYFVTGTVRITSATADAEAFLKARATVAGGVADCVSLDLKRLGQYDWAIFLRDGFAALGAAKIDAGDDLLDVDVDLGLLCVGTKVTAYWRFHDGDGTWQPVGSWTTTKAGGYVGFGSWIGQHRFDNLLVQEV